MQVDLLFDNFNSSYYLPYAAYPVDTSCIININDLNLTANLTSEQLDSLLFAKNLGDDDALYSRIKIYISGPKNIYSSFYRQGVFTDVTPSVISTNYDLTLLYRPDTVYVWDTLILGDYYDDENIFGITTGEPKSQIYFSEPDCRPGNAEGYLLKYCMVFKNTFMHEIRYPD